MELRNIKQVIKHNLCVGCGLCAMDEHIKMIASNGMIVPNSITSSSVIDNSCPSKGYDLKVIGKELWGNTSFCPEIGYYKRLHLAHTNNDDILKDASSGGMITQIAASMLAEGVVDGVISTRFTYSDNKVRPQTYIASSLDELIQGQGSKYCPTSTLSILKELCPNKKYLLIGTPCQIAGFRLYSRYNDSLREKIPYTVANFCGGYRDFRELDFFISNIAHIPNVIYFRHRGGGQPGSMKIEGEKGELFVFPYPEYARLSPFVKNERCTLCMDATGELADFSCGDAWLENRDKSHPWSIVITRSEFAESFIKKLHDNAVISEENQLSEEEVIMSQLSNITSKKYRQFKRIRLRNIIGLYSPVWKDLSSKEGSYLNELRILLSKAKSRWLHKR